MKKSIFVRPDTKMEKKHPLLNYVTRKAKPEPFRKKQPFQKKFRSKNASDLLKNSSYNNPLLKLQNDMITNLSDLTKQTSYRGKSSYTMGVPVMKQQSSLLGNYGLEQSSNASQLFRTNTVFNEFNRERMNKEELLRDDNEKTFSSKATTQPQMKPHTQRNTLDTMFKKMNEKQRNEDNKYVDTMFDSVENEEMYDELSNSIVNDAVDKGYAKSSERFQYKREMKDFNNIFLDSEETVGLGGPFGEDEDEEDETKDDINVDKFKTPAGKPITAVDKGITKPDGSGNSSANSSDDDDLSPRNQNFLNQTKQKSWKNNNSVGTIKVGKREIDITKMQKGRNEGEFVVKGKFGKGGKNYSIYVIKSDGKGGFKQQGKSITSDEANQYTKLPSISSKKKGQGKGKGKGKGKNTSVPVAGGAGVGLV